MTLTVYLRHAVKKITAKKTEIIDQPRFHADTHSTSQKCPLISSLTPLCDSTNYLALFRSYQRAIIHCQTFSVARGERNAHFSVLAPRLRSQCFSLLLYLLFFRDWNAVFQYHTIQCLLIFCSTYHRQPSVCFTEASRLF